jgi:hypothetical protein
MKRSIALVGVGLALALSAPAMTEDPSGAGAPAPQLSPRGWALTEIEADRQAVIEALAAGVPERDAESYLAKLAGLENHELIDLMVSGGDVGIESFGTEGDYANMVYTALAAPCRLLDTRKYTGPASIPIAAGNAREVWDYNIAGQGGDTTCTGPLIGKSALVLAITAISPTFPNKFTSLGYGTLLNGAEMATGWTYVGATPTNHYNYTYDTPPYNKAVSIVWDQDTRFIQSLAVVTTQSPVPDVVLYSSQNAHFTLDAVGYLEDPDLCPANTTFIDGQCWGPEQGHTSWFGATSDCSDEGGQLPTAAAVVGAVLDGDLPNVLLWGAGWYYDGTTFRGQAQNAGLSVQTTTSMIQYRCVFTPLTAP